MNILIITTYFPPDTAIASVRPYMFAKYLTRMGHRVTVLRSGMLSCTADRSMSFHDMGIRVISYLGENAPAERFERGEEVQTQFSQSKKRSALLPYAVRKTVGQSVQSLKNRMVGLKIQRAKQRFALQKKCIDALRDEHFDAVFATYSQLENVYAGKYASEIFGCKWVLDFRDPIAQRGNCDYLTYLRWRQVQKKAVLSADVCTAVSDGVAEKVGAGTDQNVITLYNGYDNATALKNESPDDGILRFCYTGVMYQNRSCADSLFRVIDQLRKENKLDLKKVRLEYAGPHYEMILEQAKRHHVEEILVNHGFVTREEATKIQARSDVFLVLTWNTAYEKGVLTGKFFEGIRARKPILTLVSGDVPNSELFTLNEKYHYGHCYEECSRDENYVQLYRWIEDAYQRKQNGLAAEYMPHDGLFEDFTYQKLTAKLEGIVRERHYGAESTENMH